MISIINTQSKQLSFVTLSVGEIYFDMTDGIRRNLYMIVSLNEKQKTCRFLALRTNMLTYEIPYKGLQIQQVT